MANVILEKDTWKIGFRNRQGIAIMVLAGLVLMFFIISNFVWLTSYDPNVVTETLAGRGIVDPTTQDLDAYVRFNILVTIGGNTLVMGLFIALIWWGIKSKRFGFMFGVFWLVIFLANTFSIPFYTVQIDALSIISSILYFGLFLLMIYWILLLMQHRTRLRVELAKKKRN